jgi:hypothetical protein
MRSIIAVCIVVIVLALAALEVVASHLVFERFAPGDVGSAAWPAR